MVHHSPYFFSLPNILTIQTIVGIFIKAIKVSLTIKNQSTAFIPPYSLSLTSISQRLITIVIIFKEAYEVSLTIPIPYQMLHSIKL
jgi:hypothetical protein